MREDERLTERIRANRRVNGSPRHPRRTAAGDGERGGRKRVEWLMRQAGISGMVARKPGLRRIHVPGVRVWENLVDRGFLATAHNLLRSPTWPAPHPPRLKSPGDPRVPPKGSMAPRAALGPRSD